MATNTEVIWMPEVRWLFMLEPRSDSINRVHGHTMIKLGESNYAFVRHDVYGPDVLAWKVVKNRWGSRFVDSPTWATLNEMFPNMITVHDGEWYICSEDDIITYELLQSRYYRDLCPSTR